jgi:hypothetical protein
LYDLHPKEAVVQSSVAAWTKTDEVIQNIRAAMTFEVDVMWV